MLSGYASASHSHAISDITNLSTILEGITQSEVTKNKVSASAGVFDQISAESATFSSITVQVADFTTTRVSAQAMTVGGSNVSVEGHTHGMSEIEGLESLATTLSGITKSTIAKASATFQDLVVTGDVTFSVDQLDFQSITASSILVNGSSVALEGHVHSASDISDFASAVVSAGTSAFASASHSHDGLQGLTSSSITKDFASFNSISASTATFDNLVVIGDVSLSLSQVQFGSIMASDISVNGSQVSLEGHVHAMSEIDGLESSISQLNASVSAFASAMSGLDATSISKTTATFGDLVVTGSVTFSVDQLDFDTLTASTILLNGSSVAVEGHTHSTSDITGLPNLSIWETRL